ncbi:MAG: transporter substrate-binding domain-containing protein [Parachlamydiales bacterium]|nr:transporter substrate-binding domain-containing protein [Parachlamydiales bacterium]
MLKKILSFLWIGSLVWLFGCDGQYGQKTWKVGMDPEWNSISLDGEARFVYGFVEELLLCISAEQHVAFSRIKTNWDSLLEGLQQGQYDGVLASMEPYNFNTVLYNISPILLDTGPVLVFLSARTDFSLSESSVKRVAISWDGEKEKLFVQYPNVTFVHYKTVPEALSDVAHGIADAAVVSRIVAVAYLRDLYYDTLSMSPDSLLPQGLRLITLKKNTQLQTVFQEGLSQMKAKDQEMFLKKKWGLAL